MGGDDRSGTGAWDLDGWVGATTLRGPRSIRRELTGPGGTLLETLVVPERLPGIVVQYERIAGPADAAPTRLRIDVLPESAEVVARADGGRAVAVADGTRVSMVVAGPDPAVVTIDGDALGIEVPLPIGVPVSVLVMVDPADARGASFAALGAVDAHRRRAELDAVGEDHAGLRADTGAAEIDDAVAWIRARLRDRLSRPAGDTVGTLHPPHPTAADAGWIVRGALAAGDVDVARAALGSMAPSPEALLGWTRWIGWTGDHHFLLDHRDRIEAALGTLTDLPPFTAERLRKAVADAVEAAGEEAWAGRLRADAPQAAPGPTPPPARGRALPMVSSKPAGSPSDPDTASEDAAGARSLPSVEDLAMAARMGLPVPAGTSGRAPAPGAPADSGGEPRCADALADFVLDRADEGYLALRTELARWSTDPPGDDPTGAAAIAALVEGMLGIRPDAAFGRIRVAPSFPANWTRATFEGLTVERIRIGLRWTRDGGRHVFLFLPQAGSVPGMLIFEPRIPGREIREVRIDGRVAEVATDRIGDRVTLQVQLPADGERRIEVDVEE